MASHPPGVDQAVKSLCSSDSYYRIILTIFDSELIDRVKRFLMLPCMDKYCLLLNSPQRWYQACSSGSMGWNMAEL